MNILAALKEQTKEQHKNLEEHIDVLSKMFSKDDYTRLLCNFYGFYQPLEAQLSSQIDWKNLPYDFENRRKTPALEKDLGDLAVNCREIPACQDLPKLENPAEALGCLYVLEGATLGGQIISRHLRQSLEISPENGGAFFNGYGAETGAKWKDFCQILLTFADNPQTEAQIIESAKQTFTKFTAWQHIATN